MILPKSVTQKADRCSGCPAGIIRLRIGTRRNTTMAKPPIDRRMTDCEVIQTPNQGQTTFSRSLPRAENRGLSLVLPFGSCLDRPAFQREQALRPALDEDDDEDEERD